MFRWLFNRVNLYKIDREHEKLNSIGDKYFKESKQKNDPSIMDNWFDEHQREYDAIQWSRKELLSEALLEEADHLHLPRPRYSEATKWEEADEYVPHGNKFVLTPEAMMELRATIRKERRERRENAEFWLKMIGGFVAIVTGLVGALIGLFSILKHK